MDAFTGEGTTPRSRRHERKGASHPSYFAETTRAVSSLSVDLNPAVVDALAERVSTSPELADLIAARVAPKMRERTSPWMTAAQAADYLACPLSRVRKLTMTGDLPSEQEGGRRLYHREALDAFVLAGGAKTP